MQGNKKLSRRLLKSKLYAKWGHCVRTERDQGKGERGKEGERLHRKMCYQTPSDPSTQVSQPGGWRVQGQPGLPVSLRPANCPDYQEGEEKGRREACLPLGRIF